MFLSLDGIDGVGKSTQIKALAEWLEQQGYVVCSCRDPGTTALGEKLRTIVLKDRSLAVSSESEMLVYMAARAQLVREVIRPALEAGKLVISDRYLLANVVYQGHAGDLDPENIWQVGQVATGGLLPDLTLVLDLDAKEGMSRLGGEMDRMESRGLAFMEAVRSGFLSEAEKSPDSIAVVPAEGDPATVQERIRAVVSLQLPSADGAAKDREC